MVQHHWISLGITSVWTLFVLPWFTTHILIWGFISFMLVYAFLDVGHARIFRGRPNIKGQDTVLFTGNWWQQGQVGIEMAKLYARDGFNVMFATLRSNNMLIKPDEITPISSSYEQFIQDKYRQVQSDLARINSNIRTHLIIIPFNEKFETRASSSSETSLDLKSSIEGAVYSLLHGDNELKSRFRITHLINCGGINFENTLKSEGSSVDQQLQWLKLTNESLILFCNYFSTYFKEQRLKYPRFDYYILNMGNIDGFAFYLNSSTYRGSLNGFSTKYSLYHAMNSFIHSYSISLHEELKPYHIHVTCLNNIVSSLSNGEESYGDLNMAAQAGGGTSLNFNNNVAALRNLTAVEIAKIGYRALFRRKRYTIPGYFNYFLAFMWMYLPFAVSSVVLPYLMKGFGSAFTSSASPITVDQTPVESSWNKPSSIAKETKTLDKSALEGDVFGEHQNAAIRSSISTS